MTLAASIPIGDRALT